MVEPLRTRMTTWDWRLHGHDASTGKLLTRRLDVPLPETIGGLFELAHRFSYLSQELARIARLTQDCPSAISHASQLLMLSRREFKDLQRTWEMELRARLEAEAEAGGKSERIVSIG